MQENMNRIHDNTLASIGDRIRHVRKALGLNQKEFGEQLGGIKPDMISRYETNKAAPGIAVLVKIAMLGGKSLDWLLTGRVTGVVIAKELPSTYGMGLFQDRSTEKILPVRTRPIPVLNTVPAGYPDTPLDDFITDWVLIPVALRDSDAFALRVEGDCMAPDIEEGDIVVVSPRADVNRGDFGVFRIDGTEVTLKKLTSNTEPVVLSPINSEYEPIVLQEGQQLEIIGRIVYKISKL